MCREKLEHPIQRQFPCVEDMIVRDTEGSEGAGSNMFNRCVRQDDTVGLAA